MVVHIEAAHIEVEHNEVEYTEVDHIEVGVVKELQLNLLVDKRLRLQLELEVGLVLKDLDLVYHMAPEVEDFDIYYLADSVDLGDYLSILVEDNNFLGVYHYYY